MGKYTEALRKIEEERVKQVHNPVVVSPSFNFKQYALGIAMVAVILVLLVYAYGVYSGAQGRKKQVLQTSALDQNALLLVEKMMELSYNPENPAIKSEVTVVPAAQDFYSVQLIAYEDENIAKLEAQKLLKQGYQPLILRGSKYFKVCVGQFQTQEQAEVELQKLKAIFKEDLYHDAFVRLVKAKNPA